MWVSPGHILHPFLLALHTNLAADVAKLGVCRARTRGGHWSCYRLYSAIPSILIYVFLPCFPAFRLAKSGFKPGTIPGKLYLNNKIVVLQSFVKLKNIGGEWKNYRRSAIAAGPQAESCGLTTLHVQVTSLPAITKTL